MSNIIVNRLKQELDKQKTDKIRQALAPIAPLCTFEIILEQTLK